MDATTDLESLSHLLEKLTALDPAESPDLASRLADELAAALDALEEGPKA
jgi:hypothetical protein